jgi:hypothetical protein
MRTPIAIFLAPEALAQRAPGQRPSPVLAQQSPRAGGGSGGARSGGGSGTRAAEKVSANVMVVHATESGNYMDPKLKSLERHLQHLKYSSYEVLSQRDLELNKDSSKDVSVEGGWEVSLTLLSIEGEKARFRVRVSSGKQNLADITIAVAKGRTFVVSGPAYNDGILLIPITAQF